MNELCLIFEVNVSKLYFFKLKNMKFLNFLINYFVLIMSYTENGSSLVASHNLSNVEKIHKEKLEKKDKKAVV